MAFVKYSVGQITTVEDKDGVEKREELNSNANTELTGNLVVCGKCGLQHMIAQGSKAVCCGNTIRSN